MDNKERALFHELIVSSRKLATVADNAAVVLSEEFESMVTGPLRELESVLNRCPTPTGAPVWSGEMREEDLQYEYFHPNTGMREPTPRGTKVTHLPTGLSRQSYSKPTQDENADVAVDALKRAVDAYFGNQ